jgi:tetratricopeptide (TPR) repeat protein
VLTQAGQDVQALRIASTLDNTLQAQSRSYAKLITGEIAMQHGRLPEAVDAFHEAQKLRDSWISHFLLGRAYLAGGHAAEALSEFEGCKKRAGETADLMFADTATLRYLPPLYYWLARAQQGVGMSSAARENYQQFLSLRADADPDDPMVAQAKQSIAAN